MKRPTRQHLRPMSQTGIMEKKFKRVVQPTKRAILKAAHPLVVIADLRRGSISSLDRYLARKKGIPDREVLLELRKLISGSIERTRYRLVVVEHPDMPKNIGGRPMNGAGTPSGREREIAARFETILETEGKVYIAKEMVAEQFGVSIPTVDRARRKVEYVRKKQQEVDEIFDNRNEALASIRTSREKLID